MDVDLCDRCISWIEQALSDRYRHSSAKHVSEKDSPTTIVSNITAGLTFGSSGGGGRTTDGGDGDGHDNANINHEHSSNDNNAIRPVRAKPTLFSDTTHDTRHVLDHQSHCWLCFRIWRSLFDNVFQVPQNPFTFLPESISLRWEWEEIGQCAKIDIKGLDGGRLNQCVGLMLLAKSRESSNESSSFHTRTNPVVYNAEPMLQKHPDDLSFSLSTQMVITKHDDYLGKVAATQESLPYTIPNPTRLAVIKDWLNECKNCHDCISGDQAVTPPRLLHIGTDARSFKLVESRHIETVDDLHYATMSYCWGLERPFRLVQSTLQSMTDGLPIGRLGRVFQEAIHLYYELGIVYIWIDSLCIVQDSPNGEDWLKHVTLMHRIYAGSSINISATSSSSWTESLWRPLDGNLHRALEINLPNGICLYSDGMDLESSYMNTAEIICRSHRESHLFTRGWCVQEFFFSPRTLHMAETQMFWQCEKNQGEIRTPKQISRRINLNDVAQDRSSLDSMWRSLAYQYSRTKVTVPRDRYYALSSAASWFAEMYKAIAVETRYCAGHWEHSLPESLLWTSEGDIGQRGQRLAVEIPSWSWMSTVSAFYHVSDFYAVNGKLIKDYFAQAIEVEICQREGEITFGPADTALAHLRGPLLRSSRMTRISRGSESEARNSNGFLSLQLDNGKEIQILEDAIKVHSHFREFGISFNDEDAAFLQSCLLAPIGSSDVEHGRGWVHSIALQLCEDTGDGERQAYRHCGVVTMELERQNGAAGRTNRSADAVVGIEDFGDADRGADFLGVCDFVRGAPMHDYWLA